MKRIAVIVSHPIQYNSPVFKLLAASEGILLKVFYTWGQAQGEKFDPGFGKNIAWDIPMLEGYEYEFMENTAKDPGSHHFRGIINPGLIRSVSAWHPDGVIVYGWNFQSHLSALRYFKGKVPVLFRGDSTLLDERPGIKRSMRKTFLRWVYGHVDYALYTGTRNKEYFIRHGLQEDQLIFAPHAIDNARFAGTGDQYSKEAGKWRHQLGIGAGDRVVLFAGKLEPKKNPFFLLELAARIPDPRLKFLVTGNGILEKALKEKALADPRFLFLDFQNQQQMPLVYRLGDVFILPSSGPGETWGLAVNEAMACGLAVMVSDKAGCAIDLVREGENGMIIRGGDPGPAAGFLRSALEDRNLLQVMGAHSRTLIQPFNNGQYVRAVLEIMKNSRL